MERSHTLTPPMRCTQCQQPMESPIACSTCGALAQRPVDTFDCFELFGLQRDYDLDPKSLHSKYLALSRVIHPDMAGGESESRRQQALTLSAEFNRAYETLRDPVARAEYLLSLAGGPSPSEDKSIPPNLLGQIFMLREGIDEAVTARDGSALEKIKTQLTGRRDSALAVIAELARSVNRGDDAARKKLREQLNTIKYVNNLLDQIPVTAATRHEGRV